MSFFKDLSLPRFFPIILILCIMLAVMIVKLQPKMQHEPSAGLITPVHVIDLQAYQVRPSIIGFGLVEPDILLESKAEISGKISYVHPQLRNGAILPKGTVVIRIEREDYQLALQQAQAMLASQRAQYRKIKLEKNNLYANLKIVQKKLKLAQTELARLQSLLKKQSVSQSSRDQQQSKVLLLQQEVQKLNNDLKTLPEQITSAKATLTNAEAVLATQQRNLSRTEIRLPFNARISERAIDAGQYVIKGSLLFSAQTTDKILINAQFALQHFRLLAKDFQHQEALIKEAFLSGFSSETFEQLGLSAKVRLTEQRSPYWPAKVERIIGQLDPATRTLGIVVSVDKPYEQIVPGIKPPLMQGMYTEILLQGRPKTFYVLPRTALHENEIYLINQHSQLERRVIRHFQVQGEMVLWETGLNAGEQLIVSDLFPAVAGMQLKAIPHKETAKRITTWVQEAR